jgi:hypothetical protein
VRSAFNAASMRSAAHFVEARFAALLQCYCAARAATADPLKARRRSLAAS